MKAESFKMNVAILGGSHWVWRLSGITGFRDRSFCRAVEVEKGALRVGDSFWNFVRERKVSEVRRRKISKTERMERNSLRQRAAKLAHSLGTYSTI